MMSNPIAAQIISHRLFSHCATRAAVLVLSTLTACAEDVSDTTPVDVAELTLPTDVQLWFAPGSHDSLDSLDGRIATEQLVLRFEVKRGPEVPLEVLQGDPDAPLHEIDVRLIAESGEPFVERIGGHAFIDPRWSADTEVAWPMTPPEARRDEWALAERSIEHLRDARVRPEVEDLRNALLETLEASLVPAQNDEERNASQVAPRSLQASNHLHFEVWWKWADVPILPDFFGHHSSTRTMSHYASGSTYAVRITCNHGQCAASSGMSLKTKDGCPKIYLNRSLSLPPSAQCEKTQANENYSSYSCCATSYGVSPDNGRHVCHDDTRVQNALAAFGSPTKALAWCSDNDLAQYAPPCAW